MFVTILEDLRPIPKDKRLSLEHRRSLFVISGHLPDQSVLLPFPLGLNESGT
jgi:hypothetical protein